MESRYQVLHDVSLAIQKGEFVSILGKSGCGKSTLLYLLSTLDTKYDGIVEINGEKVSGLGENALAKFRNEHIGFVFQYHFLLPEFTALENVMLPALKLGKFDKATIENMALEKLQQWICMMLATQGNTIIAVTHDHDFAAKSNRIIEMSMEGSTINT